MQSKKIKLMFQPVGSSLCGQTCVAMLADISLEDSVKVFGSRGGTTTKQVVRALRELGVWCGDSLVRVKAGQELPPLCIVSLTIEGTKKKHWAIWDMDHFLDPDIGIIKEYSPPLRVTSFLPVDEPGHRTYQKKKKTPCLVYEYRDFHATVFKYEYENNHEIEYGWSIDECYPFYVYPCEPTFNIENSFHAYVDKHIAKCEAEGIDPKDPHFRTLKGEPVKTGKKPM